MACHLHRDEEHDDGAQNRAKKPDSERGKLAALGEPRGEKRAHNEHQRVDDPTAAERGCGRTRDRDESGSHDGPGVFRRNRSGLHATT